MIIPVNYNDDNNNDNSECLFMISLFSLFYKYTKYYYATRASTFFRWLWSKGTHVTNSM